MRGHGREQGEGNAPHFQEAGNGRRIRHSIIDTEKPETSLSTTALRSF